MMHFTPQGEGANAEPHLLIATVDAWRSGGVKWTVQCPYEGPRECGLIEECMGSPKEVERWGCEPHPVQPDVTPIPDDRGGWKYSEEDRKKWLAHEDALDHWKNVVHGGYDGHRTDECWFVHISTVSDYWEPEYFLEGIPEGTPISGPMKVLVGYQGSGEDTEPKFKIWEESGNADS